MCQSSGASDANTNEMSTKRRVEGGCEDGATVERTEAPGAKKKRLERDVRDFLKGMDGLVSSLVSTAK